MVKEIPLQNGMFALVDDEDYEKVINRHWDVCSHSRNNSNDCIRIGTNENGGRIQLKNFILNYYGEDDIYQKDGDFYNFQKSNLFIADKSCRSRLRRGNKNSSSKYKGVTYRKNKDKWIAQFNGKYIGVFQSEEEAAIAYNEVAYEAYGKYIRLNCIGENNNAEELDLDTVGKNSPRRRKKGNSGYKGVYIAKNGKYEYIRAYITIKNKQVVLGKFETLEQAAKAYDQKAYELYGDKAILNFPELKDEYAKSARE